MHGPERSVQHGNAQKAVHAGCLPCAQTQPNRRKIKFPGAKLGTLPEFSFKPQQNAMPRKQPDLPANYAGMLAELKGRIAAARLKAALAVNSELILLYWQIGRDILRQQRDEGWGAKVVDRLAADLRQTFPEMTGLSARNLKYMRTFAESYPDREFVQQLVAQLPWGHILVLLGAVKKAGEREWYMRQTVENGWSRNVLVHQIDNGLYQRQGKALTNFKRTLPLPQSDLAQQIVKDPYSFEFLSLSAGMQERDLERGLLEHLRLLILELGKGFAFVGSQYRLEVGGQDYYLDLLFYHLRLRCFVVFDLKIEEFKPEFAGKMNFYLSAVDDQLKHMDDQPSIGIILCKGRNAVVVEYALRDTSKPMGVAQYRLTPAPALPAKLRRELPTTDDLAGEYSLLSIAALYIGIERGLRELLERRGIAVPPRLPIASMMPMLEELKLIPFAGEFTAAVRILTSAAHGQSADASAIQQACGTAERFLAELQKLLQEYSERGSKS
jgi:predicted nuclease of restriction endonuclease-like (RecB) superfamily